jgi:hypothetical protein
MKNKVSLLFMLAGILFAACLLISNIISSKIMMLGPWAVPVGVLVFPLSYIINDVIAEVWGYRKARFIIWAGFGVNLLALLFFSLSIAVPPAAFYESQNAFATVLGSTPRIMAASLIAYLTGSFLNAFIMSRFKVITSGKGLPLRAVVSTLAGEGADSLIFITVAFAGLFPAGVIMTMVLTQALVKTVYEIAILPVTVVVIQKIKMIEGDDVFDYSVSYNPFRLNEV